MNLPARSVIAGAFCPRARVRDWLLIVALALVFTILNSLKPMQIDDTAYYYFAKQLAEHPMDPYSFEIFWYSRPQPALEVLAPPVVPYWSSLAIRLFDERPMFWKLWLLPFSLLFVSSLFLLLHRFAPGLEMTLTAMTAFSPTFLPSLNLMLDVPALSLSLCSLVLFFAACDGGRTGLAALAGFVAGIAMETKYTAASAPAVIVLHALAVRRLGLGFIAVCLAGLVFAAWECWIASRYGESHFLYHCRHNPTELVDRIQLGIPLLEILGALGPAFGFFGMTALGVRPKTIAALAGIALLGYVLVAVIPEDFAGFRWHWSRFSGKVAVNGVVFAAFGTVVGLTTLAAAWRLCRLSRLPSWRAENWHRYRIAWFLLLWLALEIAGYFALTPFPAARRTLGVAIAGVLIGGRLASRTCRSSPRRSLLRGIARGGVVLGLGFYALDCRDAYAQKLAAEDAAAFLRSHATGQFWYVGHWGFQYYAEKAGMRPVVAGESRFRKGDWLVVPSRFIDQQEIEMSDELLEPVHMCRIEDFLPLRTVPCFYAGHAPLERHDGARLTVRILRAKRDFIAAPKG